MKELPWNNWSLALKLTVIITFIVVLVVTVVTLVSIRRERDAFHTELEQQADLLLNTIAASAADSLYFLDADFLNDMMVDLGAYEVITFGRIYDEDGRIVADALDPDQRFNVEPDIFGKVVLASDHTVYDWREDQLVAGKSVMLGSQTVGAVSVGLPILPLAAKLQTVRDQGVVVALVAVLLGLVLALLFSRSITIPLQDMIKATQRVSEGDLSQPVEIHSGYEMAILGEHFNQMTLTLQYTLDQMEGEIEERKRAQIELEAAKEEAESANRAKSTFLANMSHELRTPLNAILGYTQLISRNHALSPAVRDYLQIISRSGEHLLGLINQVLDMSKIEAGRMKLNERDFDLYNMLADIEAMFLLQAQEKNLRLIIERHPDTPHYVRTDEMKLRQILINLLNNAFKFTEAGYVMLRVDYAQEEGMETAVSFPPRHTLLFTVEDTGPGIDPGELDTLFEAFVQAKAGRESGGGTGLGLTLSRQFAQLLGGDMSARNVQDKPGHGALFQFHIAVGVITSINRKQTKIPEVIALKPEQQEFRLLIVDDNADSRELLVQLLSPLGFATMEAQDGIEALDFWESWEPHFIWMDLHMPVMNGCDATKQIKASQPETIVVATTASTFTEEIGGIMACGFDDFVRKPLQTEEVFELLQRHLGVEYVFASAEEEPESSAVAEGDEREWQTAVTSLPPVLHENLKNAALQTNMLEMDRLITQTGPIQPALAHQFQQLADEFEYGKILSILESINT